MKCQLLIQNRQGDTINYANSIDGAIEWTTQRTGAPGMLTFSLIKTALANYHEGDRVRFTVDGNQIFFGYVFIKKKDRNGRIDTTCYDQMRYLKANESKFYEGVEVSDIVKDIASDFALQVGDIEPTGYQIPYLLMEDKSCLDIINRAMELTTKNNGMYYTFYDDFGKLALKSVANMISDVVIGKGSLLLDYEYTTDIDTQTANKIKLVRPNEDTGLTDVYIAQDSETINLWGTLQHYEQVDEELNEAQIIELLKSYLDIKNHVYRPLTAECIGAFSKKTGLIRAGTMVLFDIPDLGDLSLYQYLMIDKVVHSFQNNNHTMSLETRVVLEGVK